MELINKISEYIKSIYNSTKDNEFKKPNGYKNVNSTSYKK
jgi:hypothetical protein